MCPPMHRTEVHKLENGFSRVILHYGFMQDPNVPRDLALARHYGLELDPMEASYFLGREWLLAADDPECAPWRERAVRHHESQFTQRYRLFPPAARESCGTGYPGGVVTRDALTGQIIPYSSFPASSPKFMRGRRKRITARAGRNSSLLRKKLASK